MEEFLLIEFVNDIGPYHSSDASTPFLHLEATKFRMNHGR